MGTLGNTYQCVQQLSDTCIEANINVYYITNVYAYAKYVALYIIKSQRRMSEFVINCLRNDHPAKLSSLTPILQKIKPCY